MKSRARKQLCYVVGHYTRAGHTAHLDAFLSLLGSEVDLTVVVWRNDGVLPDVPTARAVIAVPHAPLPFRFISVLRTAAKLRRRGCRTFIVRIAHHVAAALAISLRPVGGDVYLWHSGISTTHRPAIRRGSLLAAGRWYASEVSLWASIHLATGLLTGPAAMADHYVNTYRARRSRVHVIPNDVDVRDLRERGSALTKDAARHRLGVSRQMPVVLYVGAVSPLRFGPDGIDLSTAADAIMREVANARFIAVGDVVDVRPPAEIQVFPSRPFTEVIGFYRAADVLVLPVRAAGFPRVLLEAMALGCPFVAYDVGGVRDVAGEQLAESVVSLGDAKALARQVRRIVEAPSVSDELAERGGQRVGLFSTENAVAELLGVVARGR